MVVPALDAALADIDTVFNGCTSPGERACGVCHLPEEAAYLRTPYTRVPTDVLRRYTFEVSDHFDDQAAAMRRLLPQGARALVAGEMEPLGLGFHGLAVVDWRSWPAEQSTPVEAFLLAWWRDVLTMPQPPYRIVEIFELCASVLRSVIPLLDRWHPNPGADAQLAQCVDWWLEKLLVDDSPFGWFLHGEAAAVPELRSWLSRHAPDRLRGQDQPHLAIRAELLGLTYDERWSHPYWADAPATN
ncbi:hypothetical protein ACI2L1_27340 [Streptomyces sp. NPDC019531]|uniref:hypothetical protein n=1 Tax=Streptomyces sp. NPDC019531 TaxID=3365062 RepID=UPI00384E03EB